MCKGPVLCVAGATPQEGWSCDLQAPVSLGWGRDPGHIADSPDAVHAPGLEGSTNPRDPSASRWAPPPRTRPEPRL